MRCKKLEESRAKSWKVAQSPLRSGKTGEVSACKGVHSVRVLCRICQLRFEIVVIPICDLGIQVEQSAALAGQKQKQDSKHQNILWCPRCLSMTGKAPWRRVYYGVAMHILWHDLCFRTCFAMISRASLIKHWDRLPMSAFWQQALSSRSFPLLISGHKGL